MFDFLRAAKKTNKAKILIVDDEPDIVQTIQDRLEMNKYTVVTAYNGKEGLEMAARHKPDVILLDVIMPIMTGLEMLEVLKKQPETRDCAVIMVTARNQPQDIIRAKTCGIEDYIVKPFDLNVLLEKIENIVENKQLVAK